VLRNGRNIEYRGVPCLLVLHYQDQGEHLATGFAIPLLSWLHLVGVANARSYGKVCSFFSLPSSRKRSCSTACPFRFPSCCKSDLSVTLTPGHFIIVQWAAKALAWCCRGNCTTNDDPLLVVAKDVSVGGIAALPARFILPAVSTRKSAEAGVFSFIGECIS